MARGKRVVDNQQAEQERLEAAELEAEEALTEAARLRTAGASQAEVDRASEKALLLEKQATALREATQLGAPLPPTPTSAAKQPVLTPAPRAVRSRRLHAVADQLAAAAGTDEAAGAADQPADQQADQPPAATNTIVAAAAVAATTAVAAAGTAAAAADGTAAADVAATAAVAAAGTAAAAVAATAAVAAAGTVAAAAAGTAAVAEAGAAAAADAAPGQNANAATVADAHVAVDDAAYVKGASVAVESAKKRRQRDTDVADLPILPPYMNGRSGTKSLVPSALFQKCFEASRLEEHVLGNKFDDWVKGPARSVLDDMLKDIQAKCGNLSRATVAHDLCRYYSRHRENLRNKADPEKRGKMQMMNKLSKADMTARKKFLEGKEGEELEQAKKVRMSVHCSDEVFAEVTDVTGLTDKEIRKRTPKLAIFAEVGIDLVGQATQAVAGAAAADAEPATGDAAAE